MDNSSVNVLAMSNTKELSVQVDDERPVPKKATTVEVTAQTKHRMAAGVMNEQKRLDKDNDDSENNYDGNNSAFDIDGIDDCYDYDDNSSLCHSVTKFSPSSILTFTMRLSSPLEMPGISTIGACDSSLDTLPSCSCKSLIILLASSSAAFRTSESSCSASLSRLRKRDSGAPSTTSSYSSEVSLAMGLGLSLERFITSTNPERPDSVSSSKIDVSCGGSVVYTNNYNEISTRFIEGRHQNRRKLTSVRAALLRRPISARHFESSSSSFDAASAFSFASI